MAVIVVSKNLNEDGILAGKLAKEIGGYMEGGGVVNLILQLQAVRITLLLSLQLILHKA
ncbi:hypothetical protein Ct9H90mP29_05450 [bacterium]|nr:MAG: hypothetical protein Ct9H90mP29_05450 [bacterium]